MGSVQTIQIFEGTSSRSERRPHRFEILNCDVNQADDDDDGDDEV